MNPRALSTTIGTDLVVGLLWALRRHGIDISTDEALTAARAVQCVGVTDRSVLESALRACLLKRVDQRPAFDAAVEGYFFGRSDARSLPARLAERGLTGDEIREVLDVFRRLEADAGPEAAGLEALLAGREPLERVLTRPSWERARRTLGRARVGLATQRILKEAGLSPSPPLRSRLHVHLLDAFGQERADTIVRVLEGELVALETRLRERLVASIEARSALSGPRLDTPADLPTLSQEQEQRVRRAVRLFGDKLRGTLAVRRKRKRALSASRTLRAALGTGGVPFELVRRPRRKRSESLVVLCDVSPSVRDVSQLFLAIVRAIANEMRSARVYAFVSGIVDVSKLLRSASSAAAAVPTIVQFAESRGTLSNYGRALAELDRGARVDSRTTLCVLGDARTNFQSAGLEHLTRLGHRARRIVWMTPEPRDRWGTGDSAMLEIAALVDRAWTIATLRDLERAMRSLSDDF